MIVPEAEDSGAEKPGATDGEERPRQPLARRAAFREPDVPAAGEPAPPDERVSDERLAKVAVQSGMASADAVEECVLALRQAEEQGPKKTLIELMMEKGVLTIDQAQAAMAAARAKTGGGLLAGYQLIEKLGEGGMGVVYKAKQVSLDRYVAVKILSEHLAQDREFVVRFEREARTAAKIEHENIVGAIDVGVSGGQRYFVMEYVEGKSVGQILDEERKIPEARALDIVIQVARAIEAAWRSGLVHRDIKPDNLLLTPEGVAKLADLGLAKKTAATDRIRTTRVSPTMGTAAYVSPEQVSGREVDIRSDIYSLGASFYHMVAGGPAFTGRNTGEIIDSHFNGEIPPADELNPEVSAEVAHVIAAMMARDPDARYPDPRVLLHDLLLVASGRRPEFASPSQSARRRAIESARVMKTETSVTYERLQRAGLRKALAGLGAVGAAAALALLLALVLARGGGKEEQTPGVPPAGIVEAACEEVRWLIAEGELEKAVERAAVLATELKGGQGAEKLDELRLLASRKLHEKREREAPPARAWLSLGEVPLKYRLLGLSEEQHAAVREVVVEAREAWREADGRRGRTGEPDAGMKEMGKKCEERIAGILTAKQRDLLRRMDELAAERGARVSELRRRIQEIRAVYDERLLELLSPRQKKLLERLLDRGGRSTGDGGAPPSVGRDER